MYVAGDSILRRRDVVVEILDRAVAEDHRRERFKEQRHDRSHKDPEVRLARKASKKRPNLTASKKSPGGLALKE
jgi:hypothetical protein